MWVKPRKKKWNCLSAYNSNSFTETSFLPRLHSCHALSRMVPYCCRSNDDCVHVFVTKCFLLPTLVGFSDFSLKQLLKIDTMRVFALRREHFTIPRLSLHCWQRLCDCFHDTFTFYQPINDALLHFHRH